MTKDHENKKARWYFGGIASVGAACVTHPLDLFKVMLQTNHHGKLPFRRMIAKVRCEQGIRAFFTGISSTILRQIIYSTARFGVYETGKDYFDTEELVGKIALAGLAGVVGGILGTPSNVINVRMMNDVKLPPERRRNYKNGLDGIFKVYRHEGFTKLFTGVTTGTLRGVSMTIGQIAFYDHIKKHLLATTYFDDNFLTHFATSLCAGGIAATLTQPLDVVKTRLMNAKPGVYKNLWAAIRHTAAEGPLAFFKGYVPAFFRLAPQTVMLFLFYEQMRLHLGYDADCMTTLGC